MARGCPRAGLSQGCGWSEGREDATAEACGGGRVVCVPLPGVRDGQDLAGGEQGDPVTEVERLVHVVGDEDDGRARAAQDVHEQVLHAGRGCADRGRRTARP